MENTKNIYDVFLSHSTLDKNIVNAICHKLESENIKCWMAPRDIKTGENWMEQVTSAIKGSHIFVIVLSKNSNLSKEVQRELGLGVNYCSLIIPFKTEEIMLSNSMEYLLSNVHWLNAVTEADELDINLLTDRVLDALNHIKFKKNNRIKEKVKIQENKSTLYPANRIHLTENELKRFNLLKQKFKNSITAGEAKYYKNELESLIALGRSRINNP